MRPSCWLSQAGSSRRVGLESLQTAYLYQNGARQTSPTSEGGPLHNWPTSVKDNICTLDMPTSCSSKMLLDYQSPFEATAVRLLREAGAQIHTKTNCDEFGMGSANLYSVHGPVINPESFVGEGRVAGGSSGGAAAGIACGASRIALASDTGGSIRTPAAYCGVYGLKPSYGLISRWGLVAYADSLDTVGLLGSRLDDVRSAFDVVSRFDRQDSTSIASTFREESIELSEETLNGIDRNTGPLSGLKVGVPVEFFPKELNRDMLPPLRNTLNSLKSMGAEIVSVRIPSVRFALSAYYVLASAEASSNLARYDGIRYGHRAEFSSSQSITSSLSPFFRHISKTRSEGFGAEVKKRILLGTYSLTSDLFDNYFLQAQRVRSLIRQDFDRAFRMINVLNHSQNRQSKSSGVDILVTPSTVDIAPTLKEATKMGIEAYTQDILTVPASLAGLPAISIPAGRAKQMPVGVTLTAQWGCEKVLFEVAGCLAQK